MQTHTHMPHIGDPVRYQTRTGETSTMDRSNGTATVNRGVQTGGAGARGIKEEIIKHLVKNGNIGKYKIEHVSLGNAALDKNNAVVLSWQDQGKNIKSLQEKISKKPNGDLKYTSPIEIFDSNEKEVNTDKDGILFYLAVKFKKDQNRNTEEENDLESDSGMGDSGQSQNGDSPEDSKWNVSQDGKEGLKNKNDSLRLNENKRRRHFANKKEATINETNDEDINNSSAEISEVRKIFLSRQELRRRYTRIKRYKKTKEKKGSEDLKKSPEDQKKSNKPMWLAANVNSFNSNFKGRPCYSFYCLPRIRNK